MMNWNSKNMCNPQHGDTQEKTINPTKYSLLELSDKKEKFPLVTELLVSDERSNIPNIFLEDWSDQSFYDNHGTHLEDLAGTGIYRIIENHPPCLKINGKAYSKGTNIFNYPKSNTDDLENIEIIFTDCYITELKLKEIIFENVGPKVIKYNWKQIPNYENNDFPIKFHPSQERKFYFDIRSGILLPGEIKCIDIGLISKYTGIHKEDWELSVVPEVHTNRIIFKFRAITIERRIFQPWNDFKSALRSLESYNSASDMIKYILAKVFESLPALEEPDFVNLNAEDEIFLYLNEYAYTYEEETVNKLKEFYHTKFEEKWHLNMMELEEFIRYVPTISIDDFEMFKKSKIQLLKFDLNLLERSFYKKYNSVFDILGETITEIQASIEKTRQNFGFKPLPPIPQSDNPPYFYFPLPMTEIQSEVKQEPTSKKKKEADKKTADKGKGGKGKKAEYIELVPKQPVIIRKTEWLPEDQDYAQDVYNIVYETLCIGIEAIEHCLSPQVINQFDEEHTKSLESVSF